MKLSVAIPTSEMGGLGAKFLAQSLLVLKHQTFKDFEVVVSDNSDNDAIENVCASEWGLDIHYFKNPIKGMAQNTNAAILAARGELIKILYLDDYLASHSSLRQIVDTFDSDDEWLVSGCTHTTNVRRVSPHYPEYNSEIYTGKNTIGSPSVVTVRNDNPLLYDERLTWLLDCDIYKRYYDAFGPPKILNSLNVVIRQGTHQMTNIISEERKHEEYQYLLNKYA